ncbi:UNVERIFIED_CONTAM: E3 ubiquitin-protein ligase WAV3 [Sesamum radiatum]|uniref:E3 ubiquitin-protein ligase WAV3 n=1 Tax=Sesamum radiatum TaxID=300843 RepID=A0AAW2UNT4_SESRA
MVGSKWMKVKIALGLKLNSCLYVPSTVEDSPSVVPPMARGFLTPSRCPRRRLGIRIIGCKCPPRPRRLPPASFCLDTPPNLARMFLSRGVEVEVEKICAICLTTMKPGHGHAIFTAECSHSFHFHCITSNVKHGKQTCPVCRAKWKEIPFQSPTTDKSRERARINNASWAQDNTWTPGIRRNPSPRVDVSRQVATLFQAAEPDAFDDDEEVDSNQLDVAQSSSSSNNSHEDHFTARQHSDGADLPLISQTSRAPVDLVTVLDVSGSMAGTKLALLKRAMGFVIQNLGPSDRLSVIAFSSTARRVFPLRKMTENGRHEALQAVNSLSSNGGTNISEALRKGAKVMTDRKRKNPVSSIILLSDGQDTYTISNTNGSNTRSHYQSLLPVSMHLNSASGLHIPVHAFGFGADHDAASMHLISETSGGTFSFIEAESVIQDAFAQCIGGLLSVVVQELIIEVECIDPILRLISIKSGSYKTTLASDKRKGTIEVGDLYAEEERDFLVTTDIPIYESSDEMSLLKVRCLYKHPISKN